MLTRRNLLTLPLVAPVAKALEPKCDCWKFECQVCDVCQWPSGADVQRPSTLQISEIDMANKTVTLIPAKPGAQIAVMHDHAEYRFSDGTVLRAGKKHYSYIENRELPEDFR